MGGGLILAALFVKREDFMKLSEMNTEQLADALCAIAEPMENIGADDEFNKKIAEFSERNKKNGGMTKLENLTGIVATTIPWLLKRHRQDVYVILSVLTGKSVQEIENQNGFVTIRDAKDCVDKELTDFFKSFGATSAGQSSQQSRKE